MTNQGRKVKDERRMMNDEMAAVARAGRRKAVVRWLVSESPNKGARKKVAFWMLAPDSWLLIATSSNRPTSVTCNVYTSASTARDHKPIDAARLRAAIHEAGREASRVRARA